MTLRSRIQIPPPATKFRKQLRRRAAFACRTFVFSTSRSVRECPAVAHFIGLMFWFRLNTLSGSYFALMRWSLAYFWVPYVILSADSS